MHHIDLNLLTALDVLLEEESVGAAASRLHLSQPAMSRTLGRIRQVTGDEILVRSGRLMVPTPFAESVRVEVHGLVENARNLLAADRVLDLAGLDRTFTIRCHDAVTGVLASSLLRSSRAAAPLVRFRFLAEASSDDDELRRGSVDLEVGSSVPASPEVRAEQVDSGTLVVVFRPGHPVAARPLTAARYAAQRHVIVSRRGRLRDVIDEALQERGLRRDVVASAPTSSAGIRLAHEADLLVVVSGTMCAADVAALRMKTAQLPLAVPMVPIVMAWHARNDRDPAHQWLRTQVARIVRAQNALR